MKKALFGILTLSIVAFILSNGTFAYFQDMVTSTGNSVTTGTWNSTVTITSGPYDYKSKLDEVRDVIDPNTPYTIPGDTGKITKLYAQLALEGGGFNQPGDLVLTLNGVKIYENGVNLAQNPIYIADIPAGATNIFTPVFTYSQTSFGNNGNRKLSLTYTKQIG